MHFVHKLTVLNYLLLCSLLVLPKGEMYEGKGVPLQPWYVVGEVPGGVLEGLVDVLGGEVLELSRCA